MSKPHINLPFRDLSAAINFYKAIGFEQNLEFTDEKASAMAYGLSQIPKK